MSDKVVILLAEDNPADKMLFEVGLRDSKLKPELLWVQDGVKVMELLRNEGEYADTPQPDIAIIDLNMPKKGGIEIVKEIKSEKNLKNILTIVLTTSDASSDKQNCYDSGADEFMIKPLEFTGIKAVIEHIEKLWFDK